MLSILPARIVGTISINLGQHILPAFMLFFFITTLVSNYFILLLTIFYFQALLIRIFQPFNTINYK